jgi:hypothetical protein
MCFSPEASFAGGAVISAIGVASLRKVHKNKQFIFASIPIFFAVQQFTEGVLWLVLPRPEYAAIQKTATYLYLMMAEVFWPTVLPLSVFLMEEDGKLKKAISILLALGVCVSLYYGYGLVASGVSPEIRRYHIQYRVFSSSAVSVMAFALYLLAAVVPLFISSVRRMRVFGYLILASCVISVVFFTQAITSVWCFLAALISVVIFVILNDLHKKTQPVL